MTKLTTISIVFWSAAIILVMESYGLFLPKRMTSSLSAREKVYLDPKKRPFCNAFTGAACLKKLLSTLPGATCLKVTQRNLPFRLALPSGLFCIRPMPGLRKIGCGRKRSNLPALTPDGEEMEDSLNSLLELSAEPAVEDLSRQIMSEAKLWEAIQEATVELNRHRHHLSQEKTQDDVAIPARSATASCALPPCYI